MEKKWYIINTQTGCEATAKTAIEERVRSQKMEQWFGDILIPSENVVELVKGQKQTKSRKFFPGYMFVQMFLNDETWHLVKHSSKVTGFVGGAPGRHPYGTSVDVRFCSKADQTLAHKLLCKMRKQGRLRALGYYSSTALHLGVGDAVANTWGKSCP